MSDATLDLSSWIGGEKVASDRPLEIRNPSDTRQLVARAPQAGAEEVDQAVAAAKDAFDGWANASPEVRSDVLDRAGTLLIERKGQIGRLLSREEGKTLAEGIGETVRAGRILKYFAGEALRLHGQNLASVRPGVEIQTWRQPLGVYGLITPWNFPIAMITRKAGPALAAGCTMVAKPSPETPLEAYILAECIEAAGLPRGVFNLVPAGREAGDHLIRHMDVDKVAFTGSTAVGKHIMKVCSERLARVSLELGGKSAAVLLPDADFQKALPSLMVYSMPISGQVCFSLTRLLVPHSRKDEFLDLFLPAVKALKVGDPGDPATQMGPLAMARQRERVEGYIAAGRAGGATLACGGRRPPGLDKGFYVEPTVFSDVTPDMKIFQEEIFGPVVSVIGYDDEEDAVRKANATRYGLNGAVYSRDVERAYRFAQRMRTGGLTINGLIVDPKHPFGGYRESGMGREGGPEGLDNYLEVKTIHIA